MGWKANINGQNNQEYQMPPRPNIFQTWNKIDTLSSIILLYPMKYVTHPYIVNSMTHANLFGPRTTRHIGHIKFSISLLKYLADMDKKCRRVLLTQSSSFIASICSPLTFASHTKFKFHCLHVFAANICFYTCTEYGGLHLLHVEHGVP